MDAYVQTPYRPSSGFTPRPSGTLSNRLFGSYKILMAMAAGCAFWANEWLSAELRALITNGLWIN